MRTVGSRARGFRLCMTRVPNVTGIVGALLHALLVAGGCRGLLVPGRARRHLGTPGSHRPRGGRERPPG